MQRLKLLCGAKSGYAVRFIKHRAFLLAFLITVSSSLLWIGCSGSGQEGASVTSISRKLFVVNSDGNGISVFDADAHDNAAPIRTIGSNTGLFGPEGIFVDTESNQIFVTNLN